MTQSLPQGLCRTCNHSSACLSLKNSQKIGRPVLYCEEFDDSSPKSRESRKGNRQVSTVEAFSVDNGSVSLKEEGLCQNCEDKKICKYPDAGNNVVYCEEHN